MEDGARQMNYSLCPEETEEILQALLLPLRNLLLVQKLGLLKAEAMQILPVEFPGKPQTETEQLKLGKEYRKRGSHSNLIPLLYVELRSESEELLCSQTFLCDLLSGKGPLACQKSIMNLDGRSIHQRTTKPCMKRLLKSLLKLTSDK